MKKNELKEIIREEVRRVVAEAALTTPAGATTGRNDFGDVRNYLEKEAADLARDIGDVSWPAFADRDRDSYDSTKETKLFKDLQKFATDMTKLKGNWNDIKRKL